MANQSQHAGTIADPIPQRLLYKKGDKVYTVATGPSTSGPTTDVVEATDTRKGIAKLSDSITSTSDAATGVTAATPLAVKYVNDKVTAIENKNLDTDKKLTGIEETLTDHAGRIDAIEAGGTGGGGLSYVVTPKILTPINGAVGQNTKITITGSGYENVFPTDARKHRIFELSKAQDFITKLETKEADADSIKFDSQLDAQTKYYARIKDVSQKEYRSNWSPVVEFTTGDVTHANTPVITLKGFADSPTDIGSGLTIEGGAYSVSDSSSDTHKATSWSIRLKNGRANVWESLNDETHKTSIEVPKGTLQKSTAYVVTVIYHSTNFNDSSPAELEFTTSNDFGTVQTPVITISGEPNKILETPSFSGGVFSCTRDPDTHESTEIQVIKSQDQSTVWTHTAGGATSVIIPKGKLTVSTQYKVKMRYKGVAYGWSAWAEKDFTTAAEFTRYLYIGVPGTSTFGVGLASEEVLNSCSPKLEQVENNTDPTHFNYALYTCHRLDSGFPNDVHNKVIVTYLKCIPKFYFAYLQKDINGTNLNDSELDALLPYVEVTKEQMKEAQRRSPYNAIVIAPADAFTDRNEAQQHGFILPRGFIDGGKEKPCFFITNTLTSHVFTSGYNILNGVSLRDKSSYQLSQSYLNLAPTDGRGIGTSPLNALEYLHDNGINFISVFAWAAIGLLSLAQGQYATSVDACAWYDSSLQLNHPKGISSRTRDYEDPSVTVKNEIGGGIGGDVFVDDAIYAKTTHNGSINGITHVKGWREQPTIGMYADGSYRYLLKETVSLKEISDKNVTDLSLYDKMSIELFNDNYAVAWGARNKSSFYRAYDGEEWALNGVASHLIDRTSGSNEFGYDNCLIRLKNNLVMVGGYYNTNNLHAGIFARDDNKWDLDRPAHVGARLMAYPNEMVTVTATADYEGAEPKKQTLKVPSGTSLDDVKAKLTTPTADKYEFVEWQKA